MAERTAVCCDCTQAFTGSGRGTLSPRCPVCRDRHRREQNALRVRRNRARAASYPSRQYAVYSIRRGSRTRDCCVCSAQFALAKGEHGDKTVFFCGECALKHNYCTECQEVKPAVEFHANKRRAMNRDQRCRACKKQAYNRADRRERVAARYGLTMAQWNQLAESQGRSCCLCRRHESVVGKKGLVVDHCHKTGAVRALLCASCNSALGLLREDPNLIDRAAEYLRMHMT